MLIVIFNGGLAKCLLIFLLAVFLSKRQSNEVWTNLFDVFHCSFYSAVGFATYYSTCNKLLAKIKQQKSDKFSEHRIMEGLF